MKLIVFQIFGTFYILYDYTECLRNKVGASLMSRTDLLYTTISMVLDYAKSRELHYIFCNKVSFYTYILNIIYVIVCNYIWDIIICGTHV